MCGIAGILNPDGAPVDLQLMCRMTRILQHRGPDGEGIVAISSRDGRCVLLGGKSDAVPDTLNADLMLGHRRLAIIDVRGGDQPLCNEDGSVWVTFNGEIYNFRALREGLQARGHHFRSRSDTEVIVHLYEEEGVDCVRRLRGMFAFGLYDTRARRLLLARDRLGKKPLYYYSDRDTFIFASELKALLLHPRVRRRIDLGALRDYLAFQYVPAPSCIIEGVRKLPAAHRLVREAGASRVEEYWDIPLTPTKSVGEAEAAEELVRRLREAVKMRLVSDVPLGAFLSGGLDSSSIVALMSQASDSPVNTFSVAFENHDPDDILAARQIARRFRTHHEEISLRADGLSALADLAAQYDEPFADTSLLPQYLIARSARKSVTVCLSGDGGDELFAGYSKYRWGQPYFPYDFLPAQLKKGVLSSLGSLLSETQRGRFRWRSPWLTPEARYGESTVIFPPETQERLLAPEAWRMAAGHDPWSHLDRHLARTNGANPLEKILYADRKLYLCDDILVKVDRSCMLPSLEVRCPFLDQEVVEFVAQLPTDLLMRNGRGKLLLRRAMAGILPPEILDREKRGFGLDLPRFLGRRLETLGREILLDQKSRSREFLDADYVERVIRRHEEGKKDCSGQIWTLTLFELWCRNYLDGPGVEAYARA